MKTLEAILPDLKLRFNLAHPDFEECYAYGYECARVGLEEIENPYREQTHEHNLWLEGWWAGFYGEEPLFESESISAADDELQKEPANDSHYHRNSFLTLVFEISGAIAASAIVGYQLLELVA